MDSYDLVIGCTPAALALVSGCNRTNQRANESTMTAAVTALIRTAPGVADEPAYDALELATAQAPGSVRSDHVASQAQQSDMTSLYTTSERQMILDNYDLEVADRTRMLEQELAFALAALKRRLQGEAARITAAGHHRMTAGEFFLRFDGDIAMVGEVMKQQQLRTRAEEQASDIAQEIQQTIKKRKRAQTDGSGSLTAEDEQHAKSPSKLSNHHKKIQLGRTPTKYPLNDAGINKTQNNWSSAMKADVAAKRIPSGRYMPSSKSSRSVTKQISGEDTASNFVYRARPSIQLSSRLPQTPQVASASLARAGATTARRMPRRNESIQAYSMNGSPLGVLDLAVDAKSDGNFEASANVPSSDPHSAKDHDEDWENLPNRVSEVAPLRTILTGSPKKQLQPKSSSNSLFSISSNGTKGSALASAGSAFKAAIVAGASRAAAASKAGSSKVPSQDAFTFALNGNQQDHEAWLAKLHRDMASMQMNASQREALQLRVAEMFKDGH